MLSQDDLVLISGFRGLLAWFVCQIHFSVYFVTPEWRWHIAIITADSQTVMLFFIISGLTSHVFAKNSDFTSWRTKLSCLKRKVLRLAPIYYLSVLVSAPIFYLWYGQDKALFVKALVCALTMAQGFSPASIVHLNPTLWQVACIMWCVPAFLLGYPWLKRRDPVQLAGCFLLCWLLPYLISENVDLYALFGLHFYCFYPVRVFHFFAGVITGLLLDQFKVKTKDKYEKSWSQLADWGFLAAAVIRWNAFLKGIFLMPSDYLLMPFHVLWLLALLKGKSSYLRRLCCTPIVLMLGQASFSIACFHMPVFNAITLLVYGLVPLQTALYTQAPSPMVFAGYYSLVMVPLALSVGYLLHVCVEAPVNKLLTRKAADPTR